MISFGKESVTSNMRCHVCRYMTMGNLCPLKNVESDTSFHFHANITSKTLDLYGCKWPLHNPGL